MQIQKCLHGAYAAPEKRSGATLRRPVLDKLLRNLKRGDTLVVYKLDRVARSLKLALLATMSPFLAPLA